MLIYTLYKGGGMPSYTPHIYICTYPYIPTIYNYLWQALPSGARPVRGGVPGGTHTFICPLAMGILEVNNMYEIYCVCGQVMYNTSPAHTLPREDRICSRCEA